jgi:hypothetical protein
MRAILSSLPLVVYFFDVLPTKVLEIIVLIQQAVHKVLVGQYVVGKGVCHIWSLSSHLHSSV